MIDETVSKIEARIDKWLWAVRVFKTRTIAADACKKGRVMMAGAQVKPSRVVRPGDVVDVEIEGIGTLTNTLV